MKREIRIYFDGDGRLVPGFKAFLKTVKQQAERRGMHFVPVAGDGQTVRRFIRALRNYPDAHVFLLVDSEGPAPADTRNVVSNRRDWNPPDGVGRSQVHLMVQLMEAWFLADRPALTAYYGEGFREGRLPSNPRVEEIPKDDVQTGLKGATEDTQKGKYHKVRDGEQLLGLINANLVRAAAPHCERLFCSLEQVINSPGASTN